ncbi:hypothetical protein LTR85_010401 [Meristemomyces frigidus]|nr:hypothetical protein LTR85_010401 [Meristemomyces frigidus]
MKSSSEFATRAMPAYGDKKQGLDTEDVLATIKRLPPKQPSKAGNVTVQTKDLPIVDLLGNPWEGKKESPLR